MSYVITRYQVSCVTLDVAKGYMRYTKLEGEKLRGGKNTKWVTNLHNVITREAENKCRARNQKRKDEAEARRGRKVCI